MDQIGTRHYRAPIRGADWTVSAVDLLCAHLSASLSKHVPGWRGATDEQLEAVARDLVIAIDDSPVSSTPRNRAQPR